MCVSLSVKMKNLTTSTQFEFILNKPFVAKRWHRERGERRKDVEKEGWRWKGKNEKRMKIIIGIQCKTRKHGEIWGKKFV